jgi:hypothetical protein
MLACVLHISLQKAKKATGRKQAGGDPVDKSKNKNFGINKNETRHGTLFRAEVSQTE